MPVIATIFRGITDAILITLLAFVALFVYSLYTNDPTLVNMIYCQVNTHSDLGYTTCMTIRN